MFRSRKSAVSVTIARAALESVFNECDRYDADETGGRLLGTYRATGSSGYEITVSGVIGPGPNARRSNTSFFQDGAYQEQIFRAIEARHPDVEHLGNWHTHHVNSYPTLSGGDVSTYRNIVNHQNHNTDFFYALLVVQKNGSSEPRYDVKHYFFRRGDESVYEIANKDVRVADLPILSSGEAADVRSPPATLSLEDHQPPANAERVKDKDFFTDFYPDFRSLFSDRLQAPYWKGCLTLMDDSHLDVVAVESADGGPPQYSIVTADDHPTFGEILAAYKGRHFSSARQAITHLERALNREIYRTRK